MADPFHLVLIRFSLGLVLFPHIPQAKTNLSCPRCKQDFIVLNQFMIRKTCVHIYKYVIININNTDIVSNKKTDNSENKTLRISCDYRGPFGFALKPGFSLASTLIVGVYVFYCILEKYIDTYRDTTHMQLHTHKDSSLKTMTKAQMPRHQAKPLDCLPRSNVQSLGPSSWTRPSLQHPK